MDWLYVAYLLILLGMFLLFLEVLVPSGVLLVLGLAVIVAGVALSFRWSGDSYIGWATLFGVLIAIPALAGLFFYFAPKTPIGQRMMLDAEHDATVARMPVNMELESLRGRHGRAISTLRPAGVVDFDGRRVDTITEGELIEAGQWVRCIDVRAGIVIVRAAPPPTLDALERDFNT
jgi:membrane-bound serine protease (ClpP class)